MHTIIDKPTEGVGAAEKGSDSELTKTAVEFFNYQSEVIHLSNRHLSQSAEVKGVLSQKGIRITPLQNNIIQISYLYGEMTIGEIVKRSGLYPQIVTRPISDLVAKNLIRKYHKPDNYRYAYIELTDYGRSFYEEQRDKHREFTLPRLCSVTNLDELKTLCEYTKLYAEILRRFEDE